MKQSYIVLEGLDGTGKSTLARALVEALPGSAKARPWLHGKTPQVLAELTPAWRKRCMEAKAAGVDAVGLFLLARWDLINQWPPGVFGVLDRFHLSTFVYGGFFDDKARWDAAGYGPVIEQQAERLGPPALTVVLDWKLSSGTAEEVEQAMLARRGPSTDGYDTDENLLRLHRWDAYPRAIMHAQRLHRDIVGPWIALDPSDSLESKVAAVINAVR